MGTLDGASVSPLLVGAGVVGAIVGTSVGAMLGATDGPMLGTTVGARLGVVV